MRTFMTTLVLAGLALATSTENAGAQPPTPERTRVVRFRVPGEVPLMRPPLPAPDYRAVRRPPRSTAASATLNRPDTRLPQYTRPKPSADARYVKRARPNIENRMNPNPRPKVITDYRRGPKVPKGLSPEQLAKLRKLRELKASGGADYSTLGPGVKAKYKPGTMAPRLMQAARELDMKKGLTSRATAVGKDSKPNRSINRNATARRPSTAPTNAQYYDNTRAQRQPTQTARRQARPTRRAPRVASPVAGARPVPSTSGRVMRGAGAVAGAATVAGAGYGAYKAVESINQAENDYRSGRISQAQLNRVRTQQTSQVGIDLGKGAAMARMTPATMAATAVFNDTLGTDPISLGGDIAGDLINGTDNTKRTLENVEASWNKSLTKQAFTDPAGAAKRVETDVKDAATKTAADIKSVGDAIGSLFGG